MLPVEEVEQIRQVKFRHIREPLILENQEIIEVGGGYQTQPEDHQPPQGSRYPVEPIDARTPPERGGVDQEEGVVRALVVPYRQDHQLLGTWGYRDLFVSLREVNPSPQKGGSQRVGMDGSLEDLAVTEDVSTGATFQRSRDLPQDFDPKVSVL